MTKAKTAKAVCAVLDAVCALAPAALDMQSPIYRNIIVWVRQRVETKLASVLFQQSTYGEALLALMDGLLVDLKKPDDSSSC